MSPAQAAARRLDDLSRRLQLPDGIRVYEDDGMRTRIVGCREPAEVEIRLMRMRDGLTASFRPDARDVLDAGEAELSIFLHTIATDLAAAPEAP